MGVACVVADVTIYNRRVGTVDHIAALSQTRMGQAACRIKNHPLRTIHDQSRMRAAAVFRTEHSHQSHGCAARVAITRQISLARRIAPRGHAASHKAQKRQDQYSASHRFSRLRDTKAPRLRGLQLCSWTRGS